MLFNSFEYLFFFPIVTIIYFLLPHRFRWIVLLFTSCIFYMFFKPEYILILLFTIIIDYYAGKLIAAAQNKKKRKSYLLVSLIANILVLAIFKYYNFINGNITGLALLLGYNIHIPFLAILLPIGLSFHTFQAMSYTIEVYRGNQLPEKHFGIYALYVMFFPQLVAGPIERPQNLLHQFYEKKKLNIDKITSGLKLISWGLFKKLVIADRLSPIVDQVYNNPNDYSGFKIIIATIFFAEQIYCDFSGYSDIAIGSARVLGFDLMKNFRNPYFSISVSEFWSRWHISLSTWFRDYLYIPLGGNRVNFSRLVFNLLLTFLLSGLWHGANWTFVIWGLLNGTFISIEIILKKIFIKHHNFSLPNFIKYIITITEICFTWLFFRSNNLNDAGILIKNIFRYDKGLELNNLYVGMGLLFIIILELIQFFDEKYKLLSRVKELPYPLRIVAYAIFISILLNFGIFNKSQFIYFQF